MKRKSLCRGKIPIMPKILVKQHSVDADYRVSATFFRSSEFAGETNSTTDDFLSDASVSEIASRGRRYPIPNNLEFGEDGILYFKKQFIPINSKMRRHGRFVFNFSAIVDCGNFLQEADTDFYMEKYDLNSMRVNKRVLWLTNMYFSEIMEEIDISECVIQNSIFKGITIKGHLPTIINCRFSNCIFAVETFAENDYIANCTFDNCKFPNGIAVNLSEFKNCDFRNSKCYMHRCNFKNCNFESGLKRIYYPEYVDGYVGNTNFEIFAFSDTVLKLKDISLSRLKVFIFCHKIHEDIVKGIYDERKRTFEEAKSDERIIYEAQLKAEKMLSQSTVYGSKRKCAIIPYASEKKPIMTETEDLKFVYFNDFECKAVR